MKKKILVLCIFYSAFIFLNFYQLPQELFDLRLARVLTAFATGAVLALSGALLQIVFSNPLCDPYVLGISSWAVLGAVLGFGSLSNLTISTSSMIGGSLCTFLLYIFSIKYRFRQSYLLLFGVVLGLFASAFSNLLLYWLKPEYIQSIWGWTLGDLGRPDLSSAYVMLVLSVLFFVFIYLNKNKIEPLYFKEEVVETFDIDFKKVRRLVLVTCSLLVSFVVSQVGVIGFVGLLVPFFTRRIFGARFLKFLPGVYVLGGTFLLCSDWLARFIIWPREMPVGVITTAVGAPVFLYILLKRST